ncbi:MAG: serine/threonine-protein kinase, partial [Acidobacteriota bacterium]
MSNGPAAEHRWQRVKELMQAALDLEPPARAPYLREECADDELRHEVESLLAAHEEAGDFLEGAPDSALFAGMFSPGDRVGAYRIKRLVGEGGMGMVYEAARADGEFRRRVAVKVVSEGVADFAIKRFRAERQILADIDHPFIARLLDGGTTGDGAPYLVMEFIDGEPIDRYCDRRQLDLRQRLALFHDVCDAVRHAHQHQVVHRDLKPGNVIVTEDGMPKLLDFGVAKLLDSARDSDTGEPRRAGQVPMTPSFASPEQLVGDRTTPASDVYSLGVLLYL